MTRWFGPSTVQQRHRGPIVASGALLTPRRDVVVEIADSSADGAEHRFVQEHGPFQHYVRTVRIDGDTAEEITQFRLAIPIWRPLFTPLMKRVIASADRRPRTRWWWPRDVISEQTTRLISFLAVLSVVAGYLGVIISQTIAFAARDFGVDDAVQSSTLAAVRIGVFVSVLLIHRADRIGRRPLILGFTFGAIAFTMLGSLSPNMLALGATQAIARGLDTGLLTLLSLAVLEEVPAEVRSLGVGLMTMASGLGAGFVVFALPLADTSIGGWRWIYALAVVFLPLLWWIGKHLPETRRFTAADQHDAPGTISRKWFILLGIGAFAGSLFLSPASQLKNEYLLDERGFSAATISLYQLAIGTPVGLSILPAAYLADRFGRKPVGGIALAIGAWATASLYFFDGLGLWMFSLIGIWALSGSYPAIRSFQSELFPTRARAKVGGWLDLFSVSGSAVGLLIAGYLSTRWGSLGPAISVLLIGPIIAVSLVLFAYPETAKRELETIHPSDPTPRP